MNQSQLTLKTNIEFPREISTPSTRLPRDMSTPSTRLPRE